MRRVALGVLAVGLVLGAAAPAHAASATRRVDKVLIVSVPRLTWDTVATERPPALLQLLQRSAVASMSLRTVSARTTLGEGYATIGAGNRASVVDVTAGNAIDADESFEDSRAADVYLRRVGALPRGNVLELGLADSRRRNSRLLYGSRLGELGKSLQRHRRRTAVIANADADASTTLLPDGGLHREAAFAVMDNLGRIDNGTVSSRLLVADDAAPFGRRLDPDATAAAFATAWPQSDVVLLELSDLERADAYGSFSTADVRRANRAHALQLSDDILSRALAVVDPARTLILVTTPAAPRTGEQLGIGAVAGPGVTPGLARSGTTRRAGYVTLPDVAPTVLDALGITAPKAMNGTPITSRGGGAPTVTTARKLATDNTRALFRDRATGPVSVVFVAFQVLVYAAGVVALLRRRSSRTGATIAYLALVVLAMPLLGFLSGLFRYDHLGIGGYVAVLLGAAAGLAAVVWPLRRRHAVLPPAVLIAATFVLLIVDVVLGGRLQLDTVFGYSPIVAGRFSGFGNLAYGLLAMTSIVTATVAWALWRSRRWTPVVVGGVLGVALLVDGAPPWGADVGGVLASGPAFFAVAALLRGWQISWRKWLLAAAGTIAALTAFALADLARPPSSRTHLGRLVANPGDLGDVLQRKLLSNLHILTSSIWTLIIPVALGFFIFLAARPPGLLREIQQRVPGLRACLIGGLLAGLLGFAVNDSGVAVPAMMLAVVLPYLTYLLVTTNLDDR
ncbi:MAG TPA: hypothetical protein VFB78_17430 [Acidimicrobiales bacterium]|nr:hypothetical protein [Acidimicrobiales bacterium]